MSAKPKNLVALGHIAGAHGIKGDVLVKTYTEVPSNIAAYGPLCDEDGGRWFELALIRVTGKGAIVAIAGVSDRTAAEALRGVTLLVPRSALPAPEVGEWYYEDLIGLSAVSPQGADLGQVISVQNFGAGDLLELRLEGRRDSQLIPFNETFVPQVDFDGGRVIVALPSDDE